MKYSIIALLPFIISCSNSKNNTTSEIPVDSLKKYSYLISGDTVLPIGIGHVQGTVFFIISKSKTFLVVAKHTLSGCDNYNFKEPRSPSIMKVLVSNDTLTIHTGIIKDTANCLYMWQDADVMVYPLEKREIRKITFNYIDNNIREIPSKYSAIVFWGFPKNGKESSLFISKNFTLEEFKLTKLADGSFINDSINYYITVHDADINENLIGFSGAPVFLQDLTSSKFVFLGVLCGTNNPESALYVVKQNFIW